MYDFFLMMVTTTLWLSPAWPTPSDASSVIDDDKAAVRAEPGMRVIIDSLYVEDGALRVDFHCDSAVTVKLLDGLRRGLTASVSYHLQLWHKRWFSDLIAERRLEWKATFDHWEQKYVVIANGERRLTSSAVTVREKWTKHQALWLIETSRLQPGRDYYLAIEAFLEPVSKENLREIRGWLAGEVRGSKTTTAADSAGQKGDDESRPLNAAPPDSTAERPGVKLRLLETLMNLIGFGGKKARARSAIFQIEENNILWQP